MKLTKVIAGVGLLAMLLGSVAVPRKASAQDTSAETAKRKVRSKVMPEYPPLAKQMNVSGKVKIEATITADGRVTDTHVIGGSPLLVNAAVEALKKWRFEPGPKETTEVVEFTFAGQAE